MLAMFTNREETRPAQEILIQANYSLSDIVLQPYDVFTKIHTVKLQHILYKERIGQNQWLHHRWCCCVNLYGLTEIGITGLRTTMPDTESATNGPSIGERLNGKNGQQQPITLSGSQFSTTSAYTRAFVVSVLKAKRIVPAFLYAKNGGKSCGKVQKLRRAIHCCQNENEYNLARTCLHEICHTLSAWLNPMHCDRFVRVSIIPFNGADGYTVFARQRKYKTNEMFACIITFVAGGVGERIFFDSALGDESDQRIAMGLAKTDLYVVDNAKISDCWGEKRWKFGEYFEQCDVFFYLNASKTALGHCLDQMKMTKTGVRVARGHAMISRMNE
ncbi:hypothetical protein niasHT_031448 [Heterodera trifolii]|uniref:SHD domain-containing protein n=1 Tax=Heterodera trifolii TaxID=157864 RepID=A0ABD2HT17_9BILA